MENNFIYSMSNWIVLLILNFSLELTFDLFRKFFEMQISWNRKRKQVSISPTNLKETFTCEDLKNVKRYWWLNWNFMLLGSAHVKAVSKVLMMKLSPVLNFTNKFTLKFYAHKSQKRKNSVKLSVPFYTFGICVSKSCM